MIIFSLLLALLFLSANTVLVVAEHKIQVYNDLFSCRNAQIVELAIANVKLSNEKGPLTNELDYLAAKLQEAEVAKDTILKEKATTKEANLQLTLKRPRWIK